MPGLGTAVNVAAVLVGGLIGLMTKGFLKDRFRKILTSALALSIIAMSLAGTVAKMLVITEDGISTRGTYMLIFSLVLGGLVGEFIDIDGKLERFGIYLKQKTGSAKDVSFVDGFVSTSLTVCVGAMAVMGAIMDGIAHDYSILFTKSVLDFVLVMIMTSSKGKGCIFSAIPIAVFQGTFTLFSFFIAPVMSALALDWLSLVGSVLILCIGVNLLGESHFRIKVANLLPAIVFAVVASYISFLS